MLNTWIYMEAIDSMPDVEMVHCDTRDFHIFLNDMSNSVLHIPLTAILDFIGGDVEDYMFARTEILGCLAALECATGGKTKFRVMRFKDTGDQHYGWVKYIRFVKYKDGYIACDRNFVPIRREWLDADNVYADNL